ncbi:hypothetical protein PSQ39_19015 [Curvibacter sp. HBC28]|uniref:Uncharacterized protein n=1 Tax=Curvibacter microcysteis TaxID=3026419 RepID=A0ABT5MJH3_9BURK|nr:hypothetical protein [Curvibacter sp. HBC28]MDD0816738.1 hypothetical protein [Curvibacter sp. HBC28]
MGAPDTPPACPSKTREKMQGLHATGAAILRRPSPAPEHSQEKIMEAERVNLIGTNLADLSARTVDLRRYL